MASNDGSWWPPVVVGGGEGVLDFVSVGFFVVDLYGFVKKKKKQECWLGR